MTNAPKLEEMMAAGMHFGHAKGKWHPKMAPYIFGERRGIHVIDLEKSRQSLMDAMEFITKLVAEKKTILFVGTKNQVRKPMKELATEIEAPYVVEKWLGGFLTNFLIFKKMIKKYQDLLDEKKLGKLEKYTKRERLSIAKEMEKLETKVGGVTKLSKLPDALFIWDIKKEKTALLEAKKKNIPVIAICDTNVNPDMVNYVIPANDDATKTIKLVLDYMRDVIKEAKTKNSK